jgi:hypothetical protein
LLPFAGRLAAAHPARRAAWLSGVGQNQGMRTAAATPAVAVARPGDALPALRRSTGTEHRGAGKVAVLMAAGRVDVEHRVAALDSECIVIAGATETLDMTIKLIGPSAEEAGTGEVLPQKGYSTT